MPLDPINSSQAEADLVISLRGSVARSVMRLTRSAVNTSLPGFAELGDIAKALVEDWKTTDRNENKLSKLVTRVEGLYSLIRELDATEYSDVSKASRRLYEIKGLLVEELKRQSCSEILGAEQKQRLLGNLKCEVDSIVETILLRLTVVQAQSRRHNPIDNFQVVSAHEITDMTITYEWNPHLRSEDTHPLALDGCRPDRNRLISAKSWQGRLGKTLVIYRTYRSNSNSSDVTETIEKDLKYLSRCLHPNIARVMGVTKGYDGVNGYVLATDGIPLYQFMNRVDSAALLVKCIQGYGRGLENAYKIFRLFAIGETDVTVKPDGHPILSPRSNEHAIMNRALSRRCKTFHPATPLVVEIHQKNSWPFRSEPVAFLGDVALLGRQRFTTLEVARLAAKHKVWPGESTHHWMEASVSPYTISAGDIGYTAGQKQGNCWTPGKLRQVGLDDSITRCSFSCECSYDEHKGSRAENGQWISVDLPVCDCAHKSVHRTERRRTEISYERVRQERTSLRDRGMKVEGAQFCMSVNLYIDIRRIEPTQLSLEPLHFHCNLSMRSDTRAFWGFLSTSVDPCSPGVDPAEVGLDITYFVTYWTVCLSDFWDYKYEKMLQSGLASMPGGYPGSYIEEVEEDEVD